MTGHPDDTDREILARIARDDPPRPTSTSGCCSPWR